MNSRAAAIAIIDTNVITSGLLTSEANAPTRRILDGMLERRFNFLLSQDLLAEYRAVLLRPKIQKLHGLSSEEVDRLLTEIVANAVVRDPDEASAEPPDEGDRHLWSLLESYSESTLVTGDDKLLKSPLHAGRILSPREFMESL